MIKSIAMAGAAVVLVPVLVGAQSKPTAATYITDEEVKTINASPGVDRQIVSLDIGKSNFAVGIIHRGKTGAPPAAGAGGGGGAAAGAGRGGAAPAAAAAQPCGETGTAPPGGVPGGISHDGQTEGYLIVSGGGTLVTGGKIYNGRKSAPESEVTTTLNGPSCSGAIAGPDVVKKVVKTGDIIIIPAGVPHGWTEIGDHVDYLSFRPDPDRVLKPYVNPLIKK
jgi:hypothetical protein